METSFVISLGITFVLLLLLIYHFKQRLTVSESKQDTMFEIINNLAQELNNMKMNLSLMNRPSTPYPHNISNESVSSENIGMYEHMKHMIDREDSDDEDSDEQDSDDEDSDEQDSDDEDSDDEDKIIVSDEEDNISVEEIRPTEDTDNSSEELVVDILENIQPNTHEPGSSDSSVDQEVEIAEETEKPDFSKMNLGTLKTYITEQGWVDDASKMKKAQILSLIQEHQ